MNNIMMTDLHSKKLLETLERLRHATHRTSACWDATGACRRLRPASGVGHCIDANRVCTGHQTWLLVAQPGAALCSRGPHTLDAIAERTVRGMRVLQLHSPTPSRRFQ